jgi:hypothetical protein
MKIKMNLVGPLAIQITDNKRHSFVALLVDRNDFLRDVEEVRNHLKLKDIPYCLPKYKIKEANAINEVYKKNKLTINEVRKALEEICRERNSPNLNFIDKTLAQAVVWSEVLLKKYNKTRPFFSVIFASILTGVITDYDFPTTYMVEFNDLKEASLELESFETDEGMVAIAVNRESTQNDVLKTFDFIRKYRFKNKKVKEDDGLINIFEEDKRAANKLIDTLTEIKQTRDWYWQNKNGFSYKKIWINMGGENANISQKAIEQAVARYKKLLCKVI